MLFNTQNREIQILPRQLLTLKLCNWKYHKFGLKTLTKRLCWVLNMFINAKPRFNFRSAAAQRYGIQSWWIVLFVNIDPGAPLRTPWSLLVVTTSAISKSELCISRCYHYLCQSFPCQRTRSTTMDLLFYLLLSWT